MQEITPAARKVLRKLSSGTPLTRRNDRWSTGSAFISDGIVAELLAAELLRKRGDTLVLSEPGAAFVERADNPDAPNRRLARRHRIDTGTATKSVLVNLSESPLAWLMRRRMISERQFEAGERLRSDFMVAGQAPRTTMRRYR